MGSKMRLVHLTDGSLSGLGHQAQMEIIQVLFGTGLRGLFFGKSTACLSGHATHEAWPSGGGVGSGVELVVGAIGEGEEYLYISLPVFPLVRQVKLEGTG
jgi:hypothetical protein